MIGRERESQGFHVNERGRGERNVCGRVCVGIEGREEGAKGKDPKPITGTNAILLLNICFRVK